MPAPVLQVKRGALSNLPGLKAGEPAFTTDSFDFYVGIDSTTNNNKFVGSHRYWKKETASSGSGVNLVESTSGSDFITLAAPASVGAAITYTFPGTITDGYFLKTNSTGELSWGEVVSNFYIGADSGSVDTVSTGSTVTFTGGTNVNTAVTDNTITINLDNDISVTNLNVSGVSTFVGVATFTTSNVYINNQLYVGGLQVTGGASIGEDITARHLSLSGIATVTGLIDANGGLDVTGHTELDNLNLSGISTFSNTADSTSKDSGAIIIEGGVGIEKSVHIGGELHVGGNVTIGGTTVTLKGEDVYIQNKDIILGFTTAISPNEDTANHAGVAIASTVGSPLVSFSASGINTLPDTYKQLMWFQTGTLGFSTDAFAFNYGLAIGTTTMANGVRLAVGSGITMSDTSISATNFYGTLNGSITGNAASADQVKTQTASNTNATYYVTFVDANNGSATNETVYTDDGIYYNPGTNTFTTQYGYFTGNVTVDGSIVGTATTATRATTVDTTGIATNQDYNLTFTDGSGTGKTVGVDAELLYNPNTNTLAAPNIKTGAVKAADGTSSITINNSTGNVTVDGSIVGTATTATRATTVDTTGIATNQDYNLTFTDGSGTGKTVGVDAELLYNPNTNTLAAPNIKTGAVKAADGTSSITINNSTGNVGIASNLTVSGDLFVLGTATEVNTDTLKVQDPLIDLGLVDNGSGQLVPPISDLNLDIGVLLNWYSGSAKKAAVYWDDSAGRIGIASDVSETNNVLTASAYAAVEIGALWVTDCAGTSQVISCTGAERFLENITVDAGTF